jgi:hypothetical protein
MTRAYWDDRKGQLRKELQQALGPLAPAYDITALTPGRPAGYGLAIDPARIHLVER